MKFNRLFLFALLATLTLALSACGAPPATNWPGISTDGELIYLSSNSHVYIVQAQNGTEATANISGKITPLRFPIQAEPAKMSFYAPAALTNDGLMVIGSAASGGHALYAVDTTTGNIRWSFETEKPWLGGALILNNAIFAPSGNGTLYSFDMSGSKRWEKKLSEHALWTTPVSDGKYIYLATLDHNLYCLDPNFGNIVWSKELDNSMIGSPAVVDGTLYVGTLYGNLYSIDASNGNINWVKPLEGSIWGTPGVSENTVYIGTVLGKAGKFYALDAATGAEKWSWDEEGSIIAGPLIVNEQVIYVTEQGRVQARDTSSGSPKWQDSFEKNKIFTTPLLVQDTIVIAPMGSQFLMVAYDLNGAKKWTFTPAQ
jgi:outer membrane protein assembly factor BamB